MSKILNITFGYRNGEEVSILDKRKQDALRMVKEERIKSDLQPEEDFCGAEKVGIVEQQTKNGFFGYAIFVDDEIFNDELIEKRLMEVKEKLYMKLNKTRQSGVVYQLDTNKINNTDGRSTSRNIQRP